MRSINNNKNKLNSIINWQKIAIQTQPKRISQVEFGTLLYILILARSM